MLLCSWYASLSLKKTKIINKKKKESRRFHNVGVKLQVFTVLENIQGKKTDTEDKVTKSRVSPMTYLPHDIFENKRRH